MSWENFLLDAYLLDTVLSITNLYNIASLFGGRWAAPWNTLAPAVLKSHVLQDMSSRSGIVDKGAKYTKKHNVIFNI